MQTAQYGRMKFGKCIEIGSDYIGCTLDALVIMDGLCSGRQACSVYGSHPSLNVAAKTARICRPGYAAYLEASYYCVNGN